MIKLDPSGTPVYSTYLGGDASSVGTAAIAADAAGNAYVTGSAGSGFPLVNPIQSTTVSHSAFVSKLNTGGSALLYSTYLGELSFPTSLAVDANGRAYVAGEVVVNSTPPGAIPLASPIQSSFGTGLSDGFVSVLNNLGTALVFSSYLGGDFASVAGLGIDTATNIYLTGAATGPFPILNAPNGVYLPLVPQSIPRGSFSPASQGFALKISPLTGTSLSHPTTVDFRPDPIPVGSSANATVLLANTSASGNVSISNIAITGDYSQANNCPQTLLPATSCKVQVTFTPTAQGNGVGNLTITDTAPGSPHVIALIGSGLVPQVGLAPTSLTFASQVVGTSSTTQVVTLTNTGGANLTISNVATTGDFSESNDCGVLLPASANCQISVSFSPTLVGNRTGTLSIIDSAAGSPHTAALSGTGVGPNLGLAVPPGDTNTKTVVAGQPAAYTLSIGGSGISGTAALSCTGAPKNATCSLPATENVDAITPATFTVTVTTTARSQGALRTPVTTRTSWLWAMGIMAIVLTSAGGTNRLRRGKVRFVPVILIPLVFIPLAMVLLISSCGGGSNTPANPNGTPAGSYTLTINAVSASNTQSATLTLVVQ